MLARSQWLIAATYEGLVDRCRCLVNGNITGSIPVDGAKPFIDLLDDSPQRTIATYRLILATVNSRKR